MVIDGRTCRASCSVESLEKVQSKDCRCQPVFDDRLFLTFPETAEREDVGVVIPALRSVMPSSGSATPNHCARRFQRKRAFDRAVPIGVSLYSRHYRNTCAHGRSGDSKVMDQIVEIDFRPGRSEMGNLAW